VPSKASERWTVSLPASRSRSVHFKPNNSPCRSPECTATTHRASRDGAGFSMPYGYISWDEFDDLYREGEKHLDDNEVQLRRFIEREQDEIVAAMYTPAFKAAAEGAGAKITGEDPS
jgi:hypothetical protein